MPRTRRAAATPAAQVLDVIGVSVVSVSAGLGLIFAFASFGSDGASHVVVPVAVALAVVTVLAWRHSSIHLVMLGLALATAGLWLLGGGGVWHGTVPLLFLLAMFGWRDVTERLGWNPAGRP